VKNGAGEAPLFSVSPFFQFHGKLCRSISTASGAWTSIGIRRRMVLKN